VQAIITLVAQAESERGLLDRIINGESRQYPKSRIGTMLHAAKSAMQNAPDWSQAILNSLPTSDVEMEAFLEFTTRHEEFQPYFRTYYTMAFKAAGLHPETLHRIFTIAREYETENWPDYDNIDWFCEKLKDVKKENPKAFQGALRLEKADTKRYIDGCANGPSQ
jgi:hypothetical protein